MSMTVSLCRVDEDELAEIELDPSVLSNDELWLDAVDLGDAWATLHQAFTGTEWNGLDVPNAIGRAATGAGGQPLDGTDAGYGPARCLSTAMVADVNRALAVQSRDEVATRLMKVMGVTPSSAHEAELAVGDELQLFDALCELYREASDDQQVVIAKYD